MREYGKEIENLKHILQKFKTNEIKSCLYFTHDTKSIYMFSETTFKQHEAEIRKPLEKRIEKLINKEISFYHSLLWKLWFSEKSPTQDELWELHTSYDPCYCCVECGYFDTIGEKCKICGSTRIELRESREEFEIDRLKELLYISNKDELIDRLLMQERQKVIAELEEWLDKQPMATYWLNDTESEEHLPIENIKQKLNDMKGEVK